MLSSTRVTVVSFTARALLRSGRISCARAGGFAPRLLFIHQLSSCRLLWVRRRRCAPRQTIVVVLRLTVILGLFVIHPTFDRITVSLVVGTCFLGIHGFDAIRPATSRPRAERRFRVFRENSVNSTRSGRLSGRRVQLNRRSGRFLHSVRPHNTVDSKFSVSTGKQQWMRRIFVHRESHTYDGDVTLFNDRLSA